MKTFNSIILIALLGLFTSCATPPCDPTKQIADWDQWTAEVRRILCAEIQACGEASGEALDEGLGYVGYGFAQELYNKGNTPCQAAIKIMDRRKAVSSGSADTTKKYDAEGNPNFGPK